MSDHYEWRQDDGDDGPWTAPVGDGTVTVTIYEDEARDLVAFLDAHHRASNHHACPHCDRWFDTLRGRSIHVTMAHSPERFAR